MLDFLALYSARIWVFCPSVINQSLWPNVGFLGVILLLMLLVTYLIYKNSLDRKNEQENLRKQIAQDFHDEMGTKLSVISMYSELTKTQLASENEKAILYLDKILNAAHGLYGSMKDLLWALDPTHDSLGDLMVRLEETGQELFEDTGIDFEMQGFSRTFDGILLPMDYKRQISLIFKEAMNNTLKHANGCSLVHLSLKIKKNHFVICLTDNGRGFELNSKHNGEGLKNMANRAKKLRGTWKISSSAKGTIIRLGLPVNPFSK